MRGVLLLSVLVFLIRLTTAESLKGTYERIIIFSCQSALSQYKFDCQGKSWGCTCGYEPLLGSMASCVQEYTPKRKSKAAMEKLRDSCLQYGQIEISQIQIDQVVKNATELLTRPWDDGFDKDEIKRVPVLPEKDKVLGKLKDYKAFLGNFDISQYYGVVINLYWAAVLIWLGIWNRLKSKSIINKCVGENINFIRTNFTLSILSNRHLQPFDLGWRLTSLLPSGPEAIILGGYFFLNTIFLFIGYDIYSENTIFGSNTWAQFIRYISDRSGVLSFAHFPLLIVFAGRNNLLISLARIPYSSFMIFHKWTARVMFIDAAIHTTGYLEIILANNSLGEVLYKRYLQWGLAAIGLGFGILFQAIHNFRVKSYELFLVLHIIFAFVFLASCWKHCETFGWLDWVHGALVIWGGDRLVRIYRLWKFGTPMAQLQFISDETFKVRVKRPHDWGAFPGCFVYIHFLHWSTFWQSHPFTIVDSVLEDDEITIYIKAKDGVTKRILDIIGQEEYQMRVSIEGPYGNKSPLEQYQTALMFAGGNGIPGPFYHALHLAEKPLLLKQRIKLIWVIRKVETLQWFEPELLKLAKLNIECDIHITRNFNPELATLIPLVKQFQPFIRFFAGRANSAKILQDEFLNAQGSIGIVTCGPPIMCDDIRSYTAESLNLCPYRVDLFEELQVW